MSSISDDDDSGPSLKELVTKNLESNGILGKLQAQLRASVFLILEEEFQEKNIPIVNERAQQQLNTRMGKLSLSLVQDFLQCLNLEFTLAVFCPETKSLLTESKLNRQYLSKEFGRNWKDNLPVLFQLIEESQNGPKKDSENKESLNGDVANLPKETPKTSVSGESLSEKQIRFTKAVDDSKSESTVSRIPSVVSEKEKSAENLTETEESISENENSHKELPESSESKNITKNESVHSVTNGVPKTSSDNSSSSSTSSSKNESSNQSTITSNHKSEKNTLSGMEKEYEEEFSSISELKNHSQDDNDTSTNDNDETEEKQEEKEDKKESEKNDNKPAEKEEESEIEEAVETAEDIEEDISSLDDLLSSNSEISNKTKDITASKENDIVDYEETL